MTMLQVHINMLCSDPKQPALVAKLNDTALIQIEICSKTLATVSMVVLLFRLKVLAFRSS
jgi:hypothetical protein